MFGFENKPPRKPVFGFYSQLAAELFGTYVYRTPSGKEIVVTAVFTSRDNGIRAYKWADRTCIGEVTELVRWGKAPIKFDKEGQDCNGRKVKAA